MTPDAGAIRARGRAIVKALRRIGDETGSPIVMDTKDARIRAQKVVYLLKAGGYGPAQKFDFNIYQNGPYSPDLTQVYYEYENDGIASAPPAQDIPVQLLESIKAADAKGVVFLEALATALDTTASLRRQGQAGTGLAPGMDWARNIKPQIEEQTWREVREFLRAHPGLAGIT
jgi:hypothetical protein